MKIAELVITNTQERAECAKILVKADYRVCVVSKTVGKTKKQVLVVDKPQGEEDPE